MSIENNDYYEKMDRVRIFKPHSLTGRIDRAIRFYSSSPGICTLQIRGPLAIGCGYTDGKSDVIANANLTRDQALALRDAIDEILENKA